MENRRTFYPEILLLNKEVQCKEPKTVICKLRLYPDSEFGVLKEMENDYFFFLLASALFFKYHF